MLLQVLHRVADEPGLRAGRGARERRALCTPHAAEGLLGSSKGRSEAHAEPVRAAVKVGASRQVMIPKKIYDQSGLAPGDFLEVAWESGRIVLTPKVLVDKT